MQCKSLYYYMYKSRDLASPFFSSFFTYSYIRSTSRVRHSGLTPRPPRVDHDMTSILFFSVELVFFRFTLGQQQVSSILPYHFKETETVSILYIFVRFEFTPSSPTHCTQNFIPHTCDVLESKSNLSLGELAIGPPPARYTGFRGFHISSVEQ